MVRLLSLLFALALVVGEASAQRVPPGAGQGGRPDRKALEQRFRQRFEQLLKERLSLTDAQLAQVIEVNGRLDARRRELFGEERTVRMEMRRALEAGDDPASQERVKVLLERALRVQRLRLELVETEQRELEAFLTPVQRVRYLGLQEQLRKRADEMRRRSSGDSSPDLFGEDGEPSVGKSRRPLMSRRPGEVPR
jgi:Spy/CpxP family protein refolding chaperone